MRLHNVLQQKKVKYYLGFYTALQMTTILEA